MVFELFSFLLLFFFSLLDHPHSLLILQFRDVVTGVTKEPFKPNITLRTKHSVNCNVIQLKVADGMPLTLLTSEFNSIF